MTAADPDREKATQIAESVLPPSNWPTGAWDGRRRELAKVLAAALRAAREEERERCISLIATSTSHDCCHETCDRSVEAIRSGAPAEPDRVREAEAAVVEAAEKLMRQAPQCPVSGVSRDACNCPSCATWTPRFERERHLTAALARLAAARRPT